VVGIVCTDRREGTILVATVKEIFKIRLLPHSGFVQQRKVFIILKDSLKADAIVFCEIGFDPKRFEIGAIAKIKIVQPATGNIIAQSEQNTFYGNSYMMPPSLEQAISDAIKGSIQGLSKKRKM
jgi:hypothetical protein